MIARPTVIVVGAGGSMPFNFPSGASMLQSARGTEAHEMSRTLCNYFDVSACRRFRESVVASLSDSLDAILETRTDLDQVGRFFIAQLILHAEHQSQGRTGVSGDWLAYLWNLMSDECGSLEEFKKNNVTFITYNYDRLIEHRLLSALAQRYQSTHKELYEFSVDRPVIHLHGTVGPFDDYGRPSVPYGVCPLGQNFQELLPGVLQKAAAGVKVVHQADPKSAEFDAARAALRDASTVFFLGFGFGRTNVRRLGLENIGPRTAIICSRQGLEDSEVGVRINRPFKAAGREPTACPRDADALLTLRTHVHLLS